MGTKSYKHKPDDTTTWAQYYNLKTTTSVKIHSHKVSHLFTEVSTQSSDFPTVFTGDRKRRALTRWQPELETQASGVGGGESYGNFHVGCRFLFVDYWLLGSEFQPGNSP